MKKELAFLIGDQVRKIKGYKFTGTVVAAFHKMDGEDRYVVENSDGLLHIFNDSQLEFLPPPF